MNKRIYKKARKRDLQAWQEFHEEYYHWLLAQPVSNFDIGMRHNLRCYIIELACRRQSRKARRI